MILELYYDGAWRFAPVLKSGGCTIRRGVKTRGDSDPAEATVTIDNRSNLYSPRSVASGLYGKIGQNTPARLTIDSIVQLTGEVASWAPGRPVKGPGWTKIVIAGVLQRLARGVDPIQSAATRAGLALSPDAYWSLEASAVPLTANTPVLTTAATTGMTTVTPDVVEPIVWDQDDTLVGSLALPQMLTAQKDWDSGSILGAVGLTSTATTAWSISLWTRTRNLNVPALVDTWQLMTAGVSPDPTFPWTLSINTDTGVLNWRFQVGAGLATHGASSVADGSWHHVVVMAAQTGGTITGYIYVDGVAGTSLTPIAATLLPPTVLDLWPPPSGFINGAGVDAWMGQVGVYPRLLTAGEITALYRAGNGWAGELAADRFTRFCGEQGITATVVGTAAESVPMGPQYPLPTLALLDEIARTDDASIFETRTGAAGLTMRTGGSKLNQSPDFTISYLGQIRPPLEPVLGDEGIRNDVNARNPGGVTARVQQLTGPRNVQAPPAGVGRYQSSVDVNPAATSGLADAAGWRVNLGVFDGTAYAEITADLDAAPGIAAAVAALDIGDVLAISSLPVDEALDTVECVIIGTLDDVDTHRRFLTFYCVPAAPYQVGLLALTTGDADPFVGRLESDGATVAAGVAAGAASFTVSTPTGPLWTTDADDFPMDLYVGGQRLTVTSITGAASPQTFNVVTIGARRVVYSIPTGAAVTVQQPVILAL